jgi:MraZ protein
LNDFDPNVRKFRRYFLNGATPVELDSAGRINLPKNLMEGAGIEKDIILSAAINKIEIWDSKKYKKFFDDISTSDFSNLANQVLGNSTQQLFG